MIKTKENKLTYLSFEQSILITLAPTFFFLLNGIIVHVLKTIGATVHFYFLLPILFFVSLFVLNQKYQFLKTDNVKKFLPVYIIPVFFATAHSLYYGTSFGSDSSSYFTNPIYTFYNSGVFSHLELPFIAYGEQPLAGYWLPYNSEFVFAGLGSLFGLEFIQVVGLMHFTSNYLFGVAVLSVVLRFMQLLPAVLFFLLFLIVFYSAHTNTYDLVSNSLFRGFENKGITWGFFLWSCINMFSPHIYNCIKPQFMLLTGVIFGASSFLVSGNAVFLLFPVTILVAGSAIAGNLKAVIFQFIGFAASLVFCVLVFKLLETTNVYDVVTENLTFRAPEKYQIQSAGFKSPLWLWGLAITLTFLVALSNLRLSIQLLVFIAGCHLIQSEMFFDLFFIFAPEFTLNFWRLATLMTPFLPILLAASYLIAKLALTKQTISFGAFSFFLIAAFIFGVLKLPLTSPFKQNKVRAEFRAMAELCQPNSLVLTDRAIGTRLPVLQPYYRYLVGKEYFLNWQIANLKMQPEEKQRALNVRDASLYISKSPTTKAFGEKSEGLVQTIANEKPDAIFMRTKRVTPENEHIFSSYIKQTYRSVTVFTKKEKCRNDFEQLATKLRKKKND